MCSNQYIKNVQMIWIAKKQSNNMQLFWMLNLYIYLSFYTSINLSICTVYIYLSMLFLNCSMDWDFAYFFSFTVNIISIIFLCSFLYKKIKLLMIMNYNEYMLCINKRFFPKIMFFIDYLALHRGPFRGQFTGRI